MHFFLTDQDVDEGLTSSLPIKFFIFYRHVYDAVSDYFVQFDKNNIINVCHRGSRKCRGQADIRLKIT